MARSKIGLATGYVAALILAAMALSSCLTAELENQAETLKEQEAEIARQRKEIAALKSGQQAQDRRLGDCNRAFLEYFERAQTTADGDRAAELYREGLAICPDDEVAHYELGRLLAAQGRYPEAETEFKSALKINPDFTDARARLEALPKNR